MHGIVIGQPSTDMEVGNIVRYVTFWLILKVFHGAISDGVGITWRNDDAISDYVVIEGFSRRFQGASGEPLSF